MKKYVCFILFLLVVFALGCSKSESPRGKVSSLKRIIKVTEGKITTDGDSREWEDIEALTSEVGAEERGTLPPYFFAFYFRILKNLETMKEDLTFGLTCDILRISS